MGEAWVVAALKQLVSRHTSEGTHSLPPSLHPVSQLPFTFHRGRMLLHHEQSILFCFPYICLVFITCFFTFHRLIVSFYEYLWRAECVLTVLKYVNVPQTNFYSYNPSWLPKTGDVLKPSPHQHLQIDSWYKGYSTTPISGSQDGFKDKKYILKKGDIFKNPC